MVVVVVWSTVENMFIFAASFMIEHGFHLLLLHTSRKKQPCGTVSACQSLCLPQIDVAAI